MVNDIMNISILHCKQWKARKSLEKERFSSPVEVGSGQVQLLLVVDLHDFDQLQT